MEGFKTPGPSPPSPSPPSPSPTDTGSLALRVVHGIEAGVVGGLAMLALLIGNALLSEHVWWEPLNLVGSTFYGMIAFTAGPGRVTLAGGAMHLLVSGSLGALFAVLTTSVPSRRRMVLLGMLAGVLWYYIADAVLWRHINPLVAAYAPRSAMLLAHAIFGLCLGFAGTRSGPPPLPAVLTMELADAEIEEPRPLPVETGVAGQGGLPGDRVE